MSIIAESPARGISAQEAQGQRDLVAIRIWLFCIAGLIFAMVLVGGATRLTDSGLSITEWKPILGAIPPLSQTDWLDAFEKYKQIPEYREINHDMDLAGFKTIYWWEWAHRFLGRFIGLAFFVPFVIFWLRGSVTRSLLPKLLGLFLLGGAQGALGWYMVMSGLVERTDVSQYRLAAHLGLAVLIYGAILWVAFGLAGRIAANKASPILTGLIALLAITVFAQIILGAFVAGTNAGLSHNTWPLMDGAFIPGGLFIMKPWYLNPFENVLTIQFNHRMLGYVIALLSAVGLWLAWRQGGEQLRLGLAVMALTIVQIGLGVVTLLSLVDITLALLHQAGAIVLLALILYQLHCLGTMRAQTGAGDGLDWMQQGNSV